MSRKPTKGYFVRGKFVAEGSELDLELKAELKGTWDSTKTDLKRESDALQDLGKELLTLRRGLLERLQLPDKLVEALAEALRITNFEGKRRQMQFIGKQMRKLDEQQIAAIKDALNEQRNGASIGKQQTQIAEHWRDRLIESDDHLGVWMDQFPATDTQQLRALMRQARKDDAAAKAKAAEAEAKGQTPPPATKGRAYRELFQLVRFHITGGEAAEGADTEDDADE